jgi:hypothetical protein
MTQSRKPFLTVVNGGKEELERKKRLLFNQPWVFDGDEFDQLCELFKLSYSEIEGLIAERIRKLAKDRLERDTLLAILDGDDAKFERLSSMLKKRKALGIKVVPADARRAPARSS